MIDKLLEKIIQEKVHDKEVAVLLSGGADSLSVALAAHRLGYDVHAYSFHLKDLPTYDASKAEDSSSKMGWKFTKVIVPVDNLVEDFHTLRKKFECVKKTQYECTFPFLYIFPQIKEKNILSGFAADGHYGVSKKACIHFKQPKELFDQFRSSYLSDPPGLRQQLALSKYYNKEYITPYTDQRVIDYFHQFDWFQVNQPYQKHHVVEAFTEFKTIGKPKHHINLQLGSGIDKAFESLLECNEINYKRRNRMLDVYRDWKDRGEIRTLFD
jgi:asparagine synthetase B (glutamine-hydrolysing)